MVIASWQQEIYSIEVKHQINMSPGIKANIATHGKEKMQENVK
jgi:hypothetical protein